MAAEQLELNDRSGTHGLRHSLAAGLVSPRPVLQDRRLSLPTLFESITSIGPSAEASRLARLEVNVVSTTRHRTVDAATQSLPNVSACVDPARLVYRCRFGLARELRPTRCHSISADRRIEAV